MSGAAVRNGRHEQKKRPEESPKDAGSERMQWQEALENIHLGTTTVPWGGELLTRGTRVQKGIRSIDVQRPFPNMLRPEVHAERSIWDSMAKEITMIYQKRRYREVVKKNNYHVCLGLYEISTQGERDKREESKIVGRQRG